MFYCFLKENYISTVVLQAIYCNIFGCSKGLQESLTNIREQEAIKAKSIQNSEYNIFGVSDYFQKHVGDKLSKSLEKEIEFIDDYQNLNLTVKGDDSKLKLGIRLLSPFDTITQDEEVNCVENKSSFVQNKRSKTVVSKDEAKLCKERIKEAVVSHERILSKTDTKAWFVRRKEADFKYKKLSNGTLVEQ
ncbi:uncharacterized protein LOC122512345 isoform X2 [Leptopilina heterotoma]|uniref:uncharacterized protein LOC122512345 isoform X2 n=1 Tax=Leptopilina heterotoma TaxID=63436 RepID=UPI001CA84825|nr:uncharacterized protein LOC122512345 isoform X2 [Leptopilina heterotoma]